MLEMDRNKSLLATYLKKALFLLFVLFFVKEKHLTHYVTDIIINRCPSANISNAYLRLFDFFNFFKHILTQYCLTNTDKHTPSQNNT